MLKSSINAFSRLPRAAVLCCAAMLVFSAAQADSTAETPPAPPPSELQILATIAPLHALTAGVVEGVVEPQLLIGQGGSAHHYSLRPADSRKVVSSNLLVCTSTEHDYYLQPLLAALPAKQHHLIEALEIAEMTLHHTGDAEHGHAHTDMHFWLNTANAIVFTRHLAQQLSEIDTANAPVFARNAAQQVARLEALDSRIRAQLGTAGREARYTTYHASLGYFEAYYGIRNARTVTRTPESGASVAEAEQLEKEILSGEIRCLFSEPEFSARLLESAARRHAGKVRLIEIDALGGSYPSGAAMYSAMLEDIARHVEACSDPIPSEEASNGT